MAETTLNGPINRRKHGRRFSSKRVPDMTPMVGLGFMLVTFFIIAGNFTKAAVINLAMPGHRTYCDPPPICDFGCGQSRVTLLVGQDRQIHYFFGLNAPEKQPELYTTNFGEKGLRQMLLQRKQQNPNIVVLIKTTTDAKYQDMVDVLDEMNITNQRKYAMVDMYPEDRELLKLNAL
ncbi:ExbD/TolR family protein [Hymenobacter sp. HDW8]|uniref:ExbD/TolR family protein n=1 Tax=Hymenobacter sp. HDW8 TaxID=2714932 RepID=UPI001407D649|nr:biopolymer transporter ExbD [Hymenobacter sp. HDW8]QIL77031.1 biopolymer transporter ExbD [Hymenobacter sp. HDW8]